MCQLGVALESAKTVSQCMHAFTAMTVHLMGYSRGDVGGRDTVAGMGLPVQTSQSLQTRRLHARPETPRAPPFHTPTC